MTNQTMVPIIFKALINIKERYENSQIGKKKVKSVLFHYGQK